MPIVSHETSNASVKQKINKRVEQTPVREVL